MTLILSSEAQSEDKLEKRQARTAEELKTSKNTNQNDASRDSAGHLGLRDDCL